MDDSSLFPSIQWTADMGSVSNFVLSFREPYKKWNTRALLFDRQKYFFWRYRRKGYFTSSLGYYSFLFICSCTDSEGCIFFIVPVDCWLGKKYDNLLRRNANIRGKTCEKGWKEEIFTVPGGKKYNIGKVGGAKISII